MLDRLKRETRKLGYKVNRFVYPNSPSASSFPFWEYFKWWGWTRFPPQFPRVIDIQTQYGCNARCVFCNVGRQAKKITGTMSDEIWSRIIDEIFAHPEVMRIHPYLLNDPLVDHRIPERLEYISKKRNNQRAPHVHFITNAGLLTEEMGYRLLRSEAIDEFKISFTSIQPELYEKMMPPLRYETVMENIFRFKNQLDAFKGKKPKLSIWTVRIKPVQENLAQERAFWKKLGINFKTRKFDNRASSDIEAAGIESGEFVKVTMCPIPFWRAWIMCNGDLIMCCVDQERSYPLGNLENSTLYDIWNGKPYQILREKWRNKNLEGLLCENCKGT
jgi:hypothetical protein